MWHHGEITQPSTYTRKLRSSLGAAPRHNAVPELGDVSPRWRKGDLFSGSSLGLDPQLKRKVGNSVLWQWSRGWKLVGRSPYPHPGAQKPPSRRAAPACNLRGMSVYHWEVLEGFWEQGAGLPTLAGGWTPQPLLLQFHGLSIDHSAPRTMGCLQEHIPRVWLTALLKLLLSCFGSFRISCWHCLPSDFSSSSITRNPFRNSMPKQSRMLLLKVNLITLNALSFLQDYCPLHLHNRVKGILTPARISEFTERNNAYPAFLCKRPGDFLCPTITISLTSNPASHFTNAPCLYDIRVQIFRLKSQSIKKSAVEYINSRSLNNVYSANNHSPCCLGVPPKPCFYSTFQSYICWHVS